MLVYSVAQMPVSVELGRFVKKLMATIVINIANNIIDIIKFILESF